MDTPEKGAADVAKDLAKPVYEDLLQPAAREVGETLARSVHAALAPLRGLVWGIEQIEEFVYAAVSRRLKDTPPDRLKTPEPSVAGPALEALRFAGKEPTLRELYANLLATAMDESTAEQAHPAFVEIIKQLTPDEAKILQLVGATEKEQRPRPVITVYAGQKAGTGRREVRRHLSLVGDEAGCQHPHLTPSYLENLCRLGLMEIPAGLSYVVPGIYEPLEARADVLSLKQQIEAAGENPQIGREVFEPTDFGRQFLAACVVERG